MPNSTVSRPFGITARAVSAAALMLLLAVTQAAYGKSKNRAPGFETIPKGAVIAIMPSDIELAEISAGGVFEPKADWTAAATRYFRAALDQRRSRLGIQSVQVSESDADELAEVNALHAAVARAISLHHFIAGDMSLPTKAGNLDWSMGQAVHAIKQKTGADYAFFSWIRDSYASSERKATMFLFALAGVGVPGGAQVGYASLVDLNTGRVLWFNRLSRVSGDLRKEEAARETLDTLLEDFPVTK